MFRIIIEGRVAENNALGWQKTVYIFGLHRNTYAEMKCLDITKRKKLCSVESMVFNL